LLTQLLSVIAFAGVLALILLPVLTISGINAGNTIAPPAGITVIYYSITTTAAQPLVPATAVTFTLIDNIAGKPVTAITWQYRMLGDTAWVAAGNNSSTASISLPGVPKVASRYEVQAISDIPVTIAVDVAPILATSKVLFITKGATLTKSETAIKNRLEDAAGLNYSVSTVAMNDDYLTPIPGYDLIVVSQEIEMDAVGTALKTIKKPIFSLGYMVPNTLSVSYCISGNADNDCNKGTTPWQVESGVIQKDAGLTAGPNILLATGRVVRVKVPAGAIPVATVLTASIQMPSAWLIEANGKLYDGTSSPARRAVFTLKNEQASFNNNGWLLFDSMTKWCLGKI